MEFSTGARWIWCAGEDVPRNFWLRARRTFNCPKNVRRALLLLTADSRYEVFVNNEWLGAGPVRSYHWAYSYDQYDITSWLQPGAENVLAVQVVHWGDHSFQYLLGRGGLLGEVVLELTDGQTIRLGSDESWRVSPDPAMTRATQRMAPQFGFEEHYDARLAEDAWTTLRFADNTWESARVIGPIGMEPWTQLEPRSIPFLTRDDTFPGRVLAAELARPLPGYRWSFDLRRRVYNQPRPLSSYAQEEAGRALVTEIIAPRACTVTVHSQADYHWLNFSCRGERVRGPANTMELQAGRNLFVALGSAEWPSILLATDEILEFDASRLVEGTGAGGQPPAWACCIPFDASDTMHQRFREAREPAELPTTPRQPIDATENLAPDIFLLTRTQQFLLPQQGFCDARIDAPQPRERVSGQPGPLIERSSALLHNDASATVLYPQPEGDLHLIIEFERLVVGYLVFEIDAPAGTIIDANLFEAVDDSGIFWTNLVHNSLRYTCREGRQTFRSRVRRGFRYVSLSIRNASRPVSISSVRCLLSTYPVEKRGRFACSDALLTRIWDVAAYTVQLCMEDTYTDCPTYEQTFYVGDARNSALINAAAFGAYDLTDRCLHLVAQSLAPQIDALKKPHLQGMPHLTTDHVVSGWYNVIPMWTMMWVWNVWEHYIVTGRRDTLTELYPEVRVCIRRCLSYLTERDLLDIPDVANLVDWTSMDMTRDGEVTANNVLLVESLRRAALMAETLASWVESSEQALLHEEAEGYRLAAERIYNAVNRYCWSEERGAYVDTIRDEVAYQRYVVRMQERLEGPEEQEAYLGRMRISEPTNTLVLLCNCAPLERAARILPLVEQAQHADFVNVEPNWKPSWTQDKLVPVGSPWFLFFTAETLIARGNVEAAINVIRKHWGYMLEKDTTTFWEMFRYWTNEHWTRSLCHGWAGGPVYFLSTYILGVQPAEPGYTRVKIEPQRCGLRWANGIVPTPQGDVMVRWSVNEQEWTIDVVVPEGITGEIWCPPGSEKPQYVKGVRGSIDRENDTWKVVLPQGGKMEVAISLLS